MPRIAPLDPAAAPEPVKQQLAAVKAALGGTPNIITTLANSQAALGGYLAFSQALGAGSLDAATRERIALTVAGANGCDYCASAHGALGRKAGLDQAAVTAALAGHAEAPKIAAALAFARAVVDKRGLVSDADLEAVRAAGWDDGAILEILGNVVLNIFTNYLNHVAETEIDFPRVSTAKAA